MIKKQFRHGLVLGKFYPLHAGHSALINSATSLCEKVTVQLLANRVESIPMETRRQWLQEIHPATNIVAAYDDHPIDYDDPYIWDLHMQIIAGLLSEPVDAVFTSDDYGAELAHRLSARWVQVDPNRCITPVSGTEVRANPAKFWWALSPPVRAWYTKKIVIVGAESTGTTTLANALAAKIGTTCIPEYGREWSGCRPGGLTEPWNTEEFTMIAHKQCSMEDEAARNVPIPLLICDTDVIATAIWHERYMGCESLPVKSIICNRPLPALYVLTSEDIPFQQDGMRDGEHLRGWMTQRFREVLTHQKVPWIEVNGSVSARLSKVMKELHIMNLLGLP